MITLYMQQFGWINISHRNSGTLLITENKEEHELLNLQLRPAFVLTILSFTLLNWPMCNIQHNQAPTVVIP